MIAVIVPTRNQPHLIEASVLSIVTQSLYSVIAPTVFVVDDCGDTDLGVIPNLEHVHSYRLPKHRGAQRARNFGYYKAKNSYNSDFGFYLFSDGDIIWLPDAFETMLDALRGSDADYVYCNYERRGTFTGTWPAGPFDEDRLKDINYISTMSIIRAKAIPDPPFIPDEERFQDWSLWLRLLKEGKKGIHVNKSLFIAHYDKDDISSKGVEHHNYWKNKIRSRYV